MMFRGVHLLMMLVLISEAILEKGNKSNGLRKNKSKIEYNYKFNGSR